MTDEQFLELKKQVEELKDLYYKDEFSGVKIIKKLQKFEDGVNIEAGSSDGLKVGTASTQKISTYGVIPVVQAGAISTPTAPGAVYSQAEAASAKTAIDAIRTAIKNFGITA